MPRRVNAFRSTPQYRTFVGGAGTLGLQTDALSHSQSVFQTLEEGRGKVIESELFERGTSLRNKAIAHLLATSINYYPMSVAASQTASHSARSVPASRMARRSGWRAEHDQNCGVGLDPDRRRSRSRVRAGYRRNRGLHENLRPGQANGVPSEQRQFSAAARDEECARRSK